jgi:hypothetical protein
MWHAATDFSSHNPSGRLSAWSYGNTSSGSFTLYSAYQTICDPMVSGLVCWNNGGSSNPPYVGTSTLANTVCPIPPFGQSVLLPPGVLDIFPGPIPYFPGNSVARWTAPFDGTSDSRSLRSD